MARRSPTRYVRFPNLDGWSTEWATYIKSDGFKIHRSLGPAKSAITRAGHGILYRFRSGRDGDLTWVPVAVIQEGEALTHPYRKKKPDQLTERVVLFTIQEVPI